MLQDSTLLDYFVLISDCNRTYTSLDGVLLNNGDDSESLLECYNDIRLPKGYAISIEFDFVQLQLDSYLTVSIR